MSDEIEILSISKVLDATLISLKLRVFWWFYFFLGLKWSWKNLFVLRDIKEVRLVHSGCIYFHIFIIIDNKISFYHIYHLYWVLFICIIAHICWTIQVLYRVPDVYSLQHCICLTLYQAGNFFYYLQINSTQGLQRVLEGIYFDRMHHFQHFIQCLR